jgi:spermidine synthase
LPFLLFFLSGVAGLVYEIAWVRSLGVVFGASHLAVATVLAVYMGGQALGSTILGDRADRSERPLGLYGQLEIGVAISAVAFLALMKVYPTLYVPMARIAEDHRVYLTVLRTAFALAALIVPTTLMGGTLPVLTRFIARRDSLGRQLSLLYAFNTLGAVAGSLLAGFVLLRTLGVTATVLAAAAVSAIVGVVSVLLQRRVTATPPSPVGAEEPRDDVASDLPARLTLIGIGISGFCALGYEVLWTRMLTLVVGTSVYSFTVMLVAFLAGLGLGSHAFVLVRRLGVVGTGRAAVLLFAASQALIGVTALGVTVLMRDLPGTADRLQAFLTILRLNALGGRLVAASAVAFAYMFVPAFFMGMAFPIAGAACSARTAGVGAAVGRVLTANTLGAIAGSVVSGFVLIYAFGIERSSQMLVVVNIATGVGIALSTVSRRAIGPVLAAAALLLGARAMFPAWGRAWDQRFFAVYTNNGRSFDTPERLQEHLLDTEVLYYHEGINETVSVTRAKGDVMQTFIVNGRPEASTFPMDVQIQRALGHIPMLLHPNPRRVFVLGTGSGMTLGATAIHESVERVVLGEIEESVLGVARTFGEWNHRVLDNPKLQIVFNDGRNHLATTRETFDVITADPIHPWSGGAAYLYTLEYFRSMAGRLAPGGIVSQWLPLYELSTRDLQTVVRTFCEGFRHVMIWVTYYDAELVGSNDPIVIDEAALTRRMAIPAIRDDLAPVHMGSAEDLLSFFMLGDAGARAFARGGDVNTDDNLVLEFSAPASQGVITAPDNVLALSAYRESLLPYLVPATGEERLARIARWTPAHEIGPLFDRAHARFLAGDRRSPELVALLSALQRRQAGYAPLRFLLDEKEFSDRCEPMLVADTDFELGPAHRGENALRISAVRQFLGRGRVLVSFVDNARREIYGQRYLYGRYEQLDGEVERYVYATLRALRAAAERTSRSLQGGTGEGMAVVATLRSEASRLVGQIPQPGRL